MCLLLVGASDYEESKQMNFKRAADDLLPALLLMLGSFTEFVRLVLIVSSSYSNINEIVVKWYKYVVS